MTATRVVDVVQPDVLYAGGLTRTLRFAALAAERGLPCTPHAANHSLVVVFTLHLLASIPNAGPYVEFSIEPDEDYPWQAEMFEPRPRVVDGRVAVPDGPGWGVEISPDWLARADYAITA